MRTMRDAYAFTATVFRGFSDNRGWMMAAAMSYYATFSLFPVLLVGVSVLGYVYGSAEAFQDVIGFFQRYAPGQVTSLVREALTTIVSTRRAAGTIGAIGLLWTSMGIFTQMEAALSMIWGSKSRPFWKSRLLALGMLMASGVCLLASLGFSAVTLRIRGWQEHVFGATMLDIPVMWDILAWLAPIALSIAAFTLLYGILPNARVRFRSAVTGAVTAGVASQLALHAFRAYLTSGLSHLDLVYGSLTGLVILILWIHYTMIVFVLGAEVTRQTDIVLDGRETASE